MTVTALIKRLASLASGMLLILSVSAPLLSLSSQLQAANLTASVDRDKLGLQETFTLTLRYDEQIDDQPDYSQLQQDFDILNTQSGSQVSIVNGTTTAVTQWQLVLAPKRMGQLLIPSFKIQGAVSDAIPITVTRASQTPSNTNDQVSVELETNKNSLKVQEQLLVTVRLYTQVNLSNASLEELKIPNAMVVELGDKQYQTRINGNQALVVETRYAVFPQASGTLTLPSLTYQVNIGDSNRDIFNRLYGNGSRANILRLRTDERQIKVEAAPSGAQPWMPAKDVQLSQHWSASTERVKVGEPITRTITITGVGVNAGQLPPLPSVNQDGLSFYQDKAQTDEQKSDQGVTASRIETTAIVANRAGRFTLPAVTLNWWDTETKSFKTASLPEVTLDVSGVAASSQGTEATDKSETTAETTTEQTLEASSAPEASATNSPTNTSTSGIQAPLWLYLTQALTLVLLVWLALAHWRLRRRVNSAARAHTLATSEEAASELQAWKQLKRALKSAPPAELRQVLLTWARLCWKAETVVRLADIARLCVADDGQDPEVEMLLKQLDAEVYGSCTETFDKSQLRDLLTRYRRRQTHKLASGLKPLYPQ